MTTPSICPSYKLHGIFARHAIKLAINLRIMFEVTKMGWSNGFALDRQKHAWRTPQDELYPKVTLQDGTLLFQASPCEATMTLDTVKKLTAAVATFENSINNALIIQQMFRPISDRFPRLIKLQSPDAS